MILQIGTEVGMVHRDRFELTLEGVLKSTAGDPGLDPGRDSPDSGEATCDRPPTPTLRAVDSFKISNSHSLRARTSFHMCSL